MDWTGLVKEKIQLKLPLLIIRGKKGFLGCGYINLAACDRTGEICAIVCGVSTHSQMLTKKVSGVSQAARELGISEGMIGEEALNLLR